MKKKTAVMLIAAAVLLAILAVPIPSGAYKDGGSREYTALTYKIVDWNRLTDDGVYERTCVYLFPDNFRSIDELWLREEEKVVHTFRATVIELNAGTATVEPLEGEDERRSSGRITFAVSDLNDIGAVVGSVVEVSYTGGIRESYPAQIDAVGWTLERDLRPAAYTGFTVVEWGGTECR